MVKADRSIVVEPLFKVMSAPLVPPVVWVVKVTAPVMALELSRVMDLSSTSVVKSAVPVTVITPLSVITSPDVTFRFPVTPTVPRSRARNVSMTLRH